MSLLKQRFLSPGQLNNARSAAILEMKAALARAPQLPEGAREAISAQLGPAKQLDARQVELVHRDCGLPHTIIETYLCEPRSVSRRAHRAIGESLLRLGYREAA